MAWPDKPFIEKIILGQTGYPRGLPPLKRLGSHEREITGIGREIIFEHYENDKLDFHSNKKRQALDSISLPPI